MSAAGVRAIDGPDEDGVGVSATGADEASGLDGGASSDGDGVRATDADGGRGDRRRAIVGSETGAGSSAGVRAIEAGPGVGDVSAVRPTDGGDTAGDGALGAWAGVRATDAGASAGGRVDRRRGVDGSSSAGVREIPSSSATDGRAGAGAFDDAGAARALQAAAGDEARDALLLRRLGHLLGLGHRDEVRARGLLVAEHPLRGEVAHARRHPVRAHETRVPGDRPGRRLSG